MEEIVKLLKSAHETVSTMESCTGGAVANAITNIASSSDVISYGVVAYSNEAKIKMGISKETIDKYSVYSIEVAKEMSRRISLFTNSTYGIGITGKLGREDNKNPNSDNNTVYISVYSKKDNNYQTNIIRVNEDKREDNKKIVVKEAIRLLEGMIKS